MKIYGWREGCDFCMDDDRFPRERDGFSFYAEFSKQVEVDEFYEEETETVNYCPVCGRKLEVKSNERD